MESIIELPDNQAGFRRAQGTRDHIANMRWIVERQLEYGKKCTYAALITIRHLIASIMNCCGKLY